MARAATKRNRGAGKAARPVGEDQKRARRKQERTLEDELFFTRLRGHAKWAFALLAIVFAGSFVFLGVGSGNAGLGDVFQNLFTGGSAPSIEELQQKLSEAPRDKTVLNDLTQALVRDGRYAEAVTAYRIFLETSPKDEEVLANLAGVYQSQADAAATEINLAVREINLAAPGASFRPGAGTLGKALGSFVDPLAQAASAQAQQRYQEAIGRYQAANRESIEVYRKLSAAAPEDPSALVRYAQSAERAGEIKTALTVYRQFVRRFPTDALVADVRLKIKELQTQQVAQELQQAASGQG